MHLFVKTYGSTTFSDVGNAISGPDGSFTLTTPPLWQNASLRLDYLGDPSHDASSSGVWEVPVMGGSSIAVSDHSPRVHQRIVVRGRTLPSRAGRRISVWSGLRPCWCDAFPGPGTPAPKRLAHAVVRTDGSYRLVVRFSTPGRKRIYALVGQGDGLIASVSRYRHLRVG
ncbi:MAG: hypothetical protein JF565_11045 [Propionibacteriales bacterium]|nr:hypothetical protein [Propionibacteriales bacterium]